MYGLRDEERSPSIEIGVIPLPSGWSNQGPVDNLRSTCGLVRDARYTTGPDGHEFFDAAIRVLASTVLRVSATLAFIASIHLAAPARAVPPGVDAGATNGPASSLPNPGRAFVISSLARPIFHGAGYAYAAAPGSSNRHWSTARLLLAANLAVLQLPYAYSLFGPSPRWAANLPDHGKALALGSWVLFEGTWIVDSVGATLALRSDLSMLETDRPAKQTAAEKSPVGALLAALIGYTVIHGAGLLYAAVPIRPRADWRTAPLICAGLVALSGLPYTYYAAAANSRRSTGWDTLRDGGWPKYAWVAFLAGWVIDIVISPIWVRP
jgi:hypothetical protein